MSSNIGANYDGRGAVRHQASVANDRAQGREGEKAGRVCRDRRERREAPEVSRVTVAGHGHGKQQDGRGGVWCRPSNLISETETMFDPGKRGRGTILWGNTCRRKHRGTVS